MESSTSELDQQKLVNFRVLYLILQMVGITLIILMISWIFIYLNGLAWSSAPLQQFNWHPLLMTIAMIYLYGNCKLLKRNGNRTRIVLFNLFMNMYVSSNPYLSWTTVCTQTKFKVVTCNSFWCNLFSGNDWFFGCIFITCVSKAANT